MAHEHWRCVRDPSLSSPRTLDLPAEHKRARPHGVDGTYALPRKGSGDTHGFRRDLARVARLEGSVGYSSAIASSLQRRHCSFSGSTACITSPSPNLATTQVYGTGFANRTGSLLCRFGETVVEASFASSSVLRCSAPAQAAPGAVDVAVSVDGGAAFGGASSSLSAPASFVHFRYMAPSFVTGLSPRSGPDTGGTVVSVLGVGFSRDLRFVCKFQPKRDATGSEGVTAAVAVETPAAFLSSSEVACIAPPVKDRDDLVQAVEVTVSVDLGGGELTSLPSPAESSVTGSSTNFTYVPRLQLTRLSPDRGSKGGGTVVDISGANLLSPLDSADTVWCRFGSSVTIGSCLSDGLVQCSSPPWSAGGATEVEVSVSVNSGADFEGGPTGSPLVSANGDCARTRCTQEHTKPKAPFCCSTQRVSIDTLKSMVNWMLFLPDSVLNMCNMYTASANL